jgi:elongation factor G
MKVYATENIRNIVLLGHASSGKTTLVECMVYEAGEISRRGTIGEESTISDHYNIEKERGNSVFSSLMHVAWKDSKINILDTPGYDDFVGEVISALKVADTGVLVLNATQGVEVGTEHVWEYSEEFKTPLVFVINQLDNEKASYSQTLEEAQGRFGDKVIVIQYPYHTGEGFNAIIDVLKMVMYKFPKDGGKPEKVAIPEEEAQKAADLQEALVEAVAEYDDTLMEAFFEAGTLSEEQLTKGIKMSMLHRELFPVFCCSAIKNMGSGRILGFLNDVAPTPKDRHALLSDGTEISCDSNGKEAVFIFKTFSEPHLGEMSYFKVYSGTLKSGDELYNHGTRSSERFTQFFLLNGKNKEASKELRAGDIGVVVKLKGSKINDTLSEKGNEIAVKPIDFPDAQVHFSVMPPNKADLEKIAMGLHQLEKEDPTVIVEQSQELRQTLIHGQGEMHLQVVKYRVEKLYNVSMEFGQPKIPYRETITKTAESHYRHKKQSGGAGQFGEVHMRIEPYTEGMPPPTNLNVRRTEVVDLDWGGKLVFNNCVVGGTIDNKYMTAIMKGVMKMMENGPITGSYVRDIRVSVFDGKMHAVDSNDMAFQIAGAQAFKAAFSEAKAVLMEPVYDVKILCTSDTMGDIISDLQTRRGVITGMDADDHYQKIETQVPLKELYRYCSSLRAITQSRAKHHRKFAHYESVPMNIQQELMKIYQESGGHH